MPLRFLGGRAWPIRATQARQGLLGLLIAGGLLACAPPVPDATIPTASPAPAAIFLPRCASSVRTQQDLDLAGLPPLVPSRAVVRCLLHVEPSGSAYDAGFSAAIELADGRQLRLYERRGGPPDKGGPTQTVRAGVRDVAGTSWSWAVLENGVTTLTAMTQGSYVQLGLAGDESQVDTLAAIAASLRPVESLPRPSALEVCASFNAGARAGATVAAAFAGSAASVARLIEAPPSSLGGPQVANSSWRAHPPNEPVAVCYLTATSGHPASHRPCQAPPKRRCRTGIASSTSLA